MKIKNKLIPTLVLAVLFSLNIKSQDLQDTTFLIEEVVVTGNQS